MDRRYQVFVSSTYEDLRHERAAVIEALLQLDCFPAGMELFPAADEDSWSLIQRVIDESDYYVVVSAGKYGTRKKGSTKSFTHLEYEYASETAKPTIALLHRDLTQLPSGVTDSGSDRQALEEFRRQLQEKNCRLWSDRGELVAAVFAGIQHLKKFRPADGWIKGSEANTALKDELLAVRRELEESHHEVEELKKRLVPDDIEGLAKGTDMVAINFELAVLLEQRKTLEAMVMWQELFQAILPLTYGAGSTQVRIRRILGELIRRNEFSKDPAEDWVGTVNIWDSDVARVLNQMVALGLIEAQVRGSTTFWTATPHGVQAGARMIAIRKPVGMPSV